MGSPWIVMAAIVVAFVFIVARRPLAQTNVRNWDVPASERKWREDQLTALYLVSGVLVFVVMAIWLVAMM